MFPVGNKNQNYWCRFESVAITLATLQNMVAILVQGSILRVSRYLFVESYRRRKKFMDTLALEEIELIASFLVFAASSTQGSWQSVCDLACVSRVCVAALLSSGRIWCDAATGYLGTGRCYLPAR